MEVRKNKFADDNWIKKLTDFEKYMSGNQGQEPSKDTERYDLYQWMKRQRAFAKKCKLEEWKIQRMLELGIDVKEQKPKLTRTFRGTGEWTEFFDGWASGMNKYSSLALKDIHWLCSHYGDPEDNNSKNISRSLKEHMIRGLNVGDIKPSECTRQAPIYDIRHNLSFVLQPYVPPRKTATSKYEPTDWFDYSSFFAADHPAISGRSKMLMEELIKEFPPWWKAMYNSNGNGMSREEIRKYVVEKMKEEDVWTDHMMVNKNGSSPYAGSCRLTHTCHAGPRRLAFSVERQAPQFNKYFNTTLVPLYGYSLTFVPKWWMGCNSLRHFTTIAELGIQLWMDVYHRLDPLSQICPPTGGTLLTYFGCFDGTIQPHRDNAPNSKTPFHHNSQLQGSTVMCLTLFDEMEYDIVELEPIPGTNGKKYVVEHTFRTSHGTLYLMSGFCDFNHKHTAHFPRKKRNTELGKQKLGLIRVAIVWRWLGRRTFAFGREYKRQRNRCEALEDCQKLVETEWKCIQSRENFTVEHKKFK